MKTIWKYEFQIQDEVSLSMPKGAKILTAFVQEENPGFHRFRKACLWAESETKQIYEDRHFVIVGTGNPIPDKRLIWIATFADKPFIWHMYEVL